jgi:hypothetical protein
MVRATDPATATARRGAGSVLGVGLAWGVGVGVGAGVVRGAVGFGVAWVSGGSRCRLWRGFGVGVVWASASGSPASVGSCRTR